MTMATNGRWQKKPKRPLSRRRTLQFLFFLVFVASCDGFVSVPPKLTSSAGCSSSTSFRYRTRLFAREQYRAENRSPPRGKGSGGFEEREQEREYLATCIPGLASVLAQELESLGAKDVETSGNAAVLFRGSTTTGLNALLWLRTAHRLMQYVSSSNEPVQTRDDLYSFVRESVNVKRLLGDGKGGLLTLSVHVVLNQSRLIPTDINHSHYTALTIKNALCDEVRDLRGDRPDVDLDDADVPLVAVMRGLGSDGAQVTLYKCLHPPGSLHKRGYRGNNRAVHKASMKESMAAGLLLAAGYPNKPDSTTLVDPMAGSGSFVIEAAMMAANLAPGLMRIKCGVPGHQMPPVVRWRYGKGVDIVSEWKGLLKDATQKAKEGMRRFQGQIIANDIHAGALDLCHDSLKQAGLTDLVEIVEGDCEELEINNDGAPVLVVTNPPWGVRLTEDMHESWESLRHFLRDNSLDGTEAWVLSGNKEATRHLGLRRSQSMVLKTAQQDLRWIQYKILGKVESFSDVDEHSDNSNEDHEEVERESPPTRKKESPRSYDLKGMNEPLTEAEREEKRNSWYL